MMTVGTRVVYPCRGPCLIRDVVNKVVAGRSRSFYRLVFLDDSDGELFVPVENLASLRVRSLLDRAEIPKLLGRLARPAATAEGRNASKHWRQRNIDNSKLFNSGSAFDLAEIVESLTELDEVKALSPQDRHTLARARRLLVCEISEVTGEQKSTVEHQVTVALRSGKSATASPTS